MAIKGVDGEDGGKAAAVKSAGDTVRPLPLIGALPVTRQYMVLGALLLVLVTVAGIFVTLDYREATYGASYVSTAADMRMLTQRASRRQRRAACRAMRRPFANCRNRATSLLPR